MKAVVLSGGGSKGSYQLGVWKALKKLRYKYEIVTGTSSGALNGAMMTQNTYFKALNIWKKMNFDLLFEEDFEEINNNIELYKIYGKNFIKNGGMNVEKLENLIETSLNKNKFYKSKINFGLVTYNLSERKAEQLQKKQIEKDKIKDYLIASATCFPAFKKKEISGNHYIDGGYYDNLPINLAIKMGAKEIIAVDLRAPGIKKNINRKNLKITTIRPNNKLTNFLDFNKEGSQRNIKFGYNDTMKVFGKLEGNKYTFKKNSLKKNRNEYQDTYEHIVKKILNSKKLLTEYRKIMKLTKVNSKSLKAEAFDTIMEKTGKSFELDETKIYTHKSFNKILKKEAIKQLKEFNASEETTKILNIKKTEIELLIKLQKNEFKEIRKIALINLPELLRAIYLYTLFEA